MVRRLSGIMPITDFSGQTIGDVGYTAHTAWFGPLAVIIPDQVSRFEAFRFALSATELAYGTLRKFF